MLLTGGKVIFPDRIEEVDVLVENGVIAGIGKFDNYVGEKIELNGKYLTAGFIDIHNHGGYGYDYMDNTEQAFNEILRFHVEHGITSAIASTVSSPTEITLKTIQTARGIMGKTNGVARLLGVHLEGPYLSFFNKGAHAPDCLRVPATDDYSYIIENADVIKQVTISPELEGSVRLTEDLVKAGIVVSMGHDNAILPEFLPVIKAGASNLTHLFCAMSAVVMKDNVRYVGLREYGLIDDNLTAEVIADNHHMTPELIKMVYKCKGGDGMCLISDCLRAGGMKKDGRLYSLGGDNDPKSQKFKVADGVAVLADGSKYAGSIQPISQMLKNIVFDANVPLVEAVKTVTITPAKIVKVDDKVGSIEKGKYADFNILDENLNIVCTIIDGKTIKSKEV